jgi:hypothetical protein
VLAALALRRGSSIGWHISVAGDVIGFIVLLWLGIRNPIVLTGSAILFATSLILLFLPDDARFYLKHAAGPERSL